MSDADWKSANREIWEEITRLDADNTRWLSGVLPVDGWFRFSRDGEDVAGDAWLIGQHSPDLEFRRRVLALIEPLVATGEASGSHYALLYDRLAMADGKPQRYGSQIVYEQSRFRPAPVEDEDKLDRLRASVGLEPIAEYLEFWADRTC